MVIYLQMIETQEARDRFEQVYLRYRGLMFYAARQILGHDPDAEDAVHDAFVSIARHPEKLSDPESPRTKAYVLTVVESKAIDLYRKKQRQSSLPLAEELAGLTVEYEGGDELARCMAKLPARDREFLLLKYAYGYENRELAVFFHLSKEAVYKLDQRAREKLLVLWGETK